MAVAVVTAFGSIKVTVTIVTSFDAMGLVVCEICNIHVYELPINSVQTSKPVSPAP